MSTPTVAMAGGGTVARVGVLPTDPLVIQSRKTPVVVPVVDSSDTGYGGIIDEICSRASTSDVVVVIGVPKPKCMRR
jgi:hypothetical protein